MRKERREKRQRNRSVVVAAVFLCFTFLAVFAFQLTPSAVFAAGAEGNKEEIGSAESVTSAEPTVPTEEVSAAAPEKVTQEALLSEPEKSAVAESTEITNEAKAELTTEPVAEVNRVAAVSAASEACDFLSDISIDYITPANPPYPRKDTTTVLLKYQYTIRSSPAVVTGTEYTFSIPDVFQFTQAFTIDVKSANGAKVGEARVDQGNNVALIFSNEAAVAPGLKGSIWLTAWLNPANIDNAGTQPVLFDGIGGGAGKVIDIPFMIDQIKGNIDLKEEGKADLANMKMNWTATLSPTLENVASADQNNADGKIKGLVYTTKIEDGQTFDVSILGACKATLEGGNEPIAGAAFAYDDTTKTLTCTFADPMDSGAKYVIKYPTKISVASFGGANSKIFKNTSGISYSVPQYDITGVQPVFAAPKTDTKSTTAEVKADMAMLDKKQSLNGRTITWTVDINKSGLSVNNAKITDTLPKGLRIVGTPTLTDKDGNTVTAANIVVDTPIEANFTKNSESKITVDLSAPLTLACTLTYQTKIHDEFYQDNKVGPFQNNVSFTGDVGGEGISYSKNATASVGTSLITKSGAYNTQDHTISWEIDVNSNLTNMQGAIVTDVIPDGLTLDETSVMIGGAQPAAGAVSYAAANKTLTVTLGDSAAEYPKITFNTTVDDCAIWANNYKGPEKPFDNKATLKATADGTTIEVSSSYQPKVESEVIRCEAVQNDYNYAGKLAKWRLTINKNQMEINNGEIEVEIPAGQKFDSFCATLPADYSYTLTTPAAGPSKLRIALPPQVVKGSAPIEIEYLTEITDLTGFNENPKINIDNMAGIVCNETPAGGVKADAQQAVANSVVKKTGEKKTGAQGNVLTWKIMVNENLIPMDAPVVSDPLMDGLVLEPGSVSLYKLGVVNGKVDESQKEAVPVWDGAIEYDSATREFLFHFEHDISDVYQIVFDTYIDTAKILPGNHTISNTASLKGGAVQQQGTPADVPVVVISDGGIADMFAGAVRITKKDENGNPLKGAQFRLNNVTKTTDENGEVLFDQLLPGTYTGKEVAAPDNCIAAPTQTPAELRDIKIEANASATIEVEVTNTRIKSALELTKTDENGIPIQGVVFRVKSAANTPAYDKMLTTGENGRALFEDLLYGSYTYEEISAPDEFMVDKTPVVFGVARDDHGTVIERTVINAHKPEPPREPSNPSNQPEPPPDVSNEKNRGGAPRTGDERDIGFFILLAGAAGVVAAIVLRRKYKNA